MELEPLVIEGDGPYDYTFRLEGIPHTRGGRTTDMEDELYRAVFAEIKGGSMKGSNSRDTNSFEFLVYAPNPVEDIEGDSVILAALEFHSMQMEYARGTNVTMSGFLTAVNAHSNEVYASLAGLKTQEEYESVSALTDSVGRIKYMAPVYKEAQPFMGWKVSITMRPSQK